MEKAKFTKKDVLYVAQNATPDVVDDMLEAIQIAEKFERETGKVPPSLVPF